MVKHYMVITNSNGNKRFFEVDPKKSITCEMLRVFEETWALVSEDDTITFESVEL